MVISRETREQAALICAVAASGGVMVDYDTSASRMTCRYDEIAHALEVDTKALGLAIRAWRRVVGWGGPWTREVDAEAEALLRTGWRPE